MTAHSKIIGLTRQIAPASENDGAEPLQLETSQYADEADDGSQDVYYDEIVEQSAGRWTKSIAPALVIVAAIAWSAFFGWVHFGEIRSGLSPDRISSLIVQWTTPILLLAVLWLLAMRNSRAEAGRFGKIAFSLREESLALEQRMRTVNEEISLARDFLAQNARELETLGRQAAVNLTQTSDQLTAALADSDEKAKTLETVSNAAVSNLEQLRKHLPVVTSAARDVTNQIGGAGNNAQLQIKSMIEALEQVGDAGVSAREYVDEFETRAIAVAASLEKITQRGALILDKAGTDAQARAGETAAALETAANALTQNSESAARRIEQAAAESGNALEKQLSNLRGALASLSGQTQEEQDRISAIIAEIEAQIATSATKLAEIDRAATEQTAKLAFAVSALGESTREVGVALGSNQASTEGLIDRSTELLAKLDRINVDIGNAIPASMEAMGVRFTEAQRQLDSAKGSADALNALSDEMLAKTTSIEHLIDIQRASVGKLMAESDEHFAARHEQADALAEALNHTRSIIEDMSENASNKLVSALLRVRETTKQAAEHSRTILDEELAHVADQLTEQNKSALAEAVDGQIVVLNELMQNALKKNLDISETALGRLTDQLGALDDMANNLELRISKSRDSFEGTDDDSFTRRMVLLTESLNSTAIDVAKILSNEVTDTAWAAYLKGDRGVFTRRAVRLLDAGEARAISGHYSDDAEFREHVNRYIHDFEAMMRVLLSTRDGHAIGVTLLSSDVGKLYVALAQAIERLRN